MCTNASDDLFVHCLYVHSCTAKMQHIVQNLGQSNIHRATACPYARKCGDCDQFKMYIYIYVYIFIMCTYTYSFTRTCKYIHIERVIHMENQDGSIHTYIYI